MRVAEVDVMFEEVRLPGAVGGVTSEETTFLEAEHCAVEPVPAQLQEVEPPWLGFEGDEGEAVPTEQRDPFGKDSSAV